MESSFLAELFSCQQGLESVPATHHSSGATIFDRAIVASLVRQLDHEVDQLRSHQSVDLLLAGMDVDPLITLNTVVHHLSLGDNLEDGNISSRHQISSSDLPGVDQGHDELELIEADPVVRVSLESTSHDF